LKGECYYRAKKHFREDLILPELLSDNFLRISFSKNDDFVRETKIVPRENTVKVKEAPMKVKILQDKTPNLGPFTGNPGVKQILSDPTKV
jgi:hypothetical protein